jgi:hypothetical protein
MASTDDQTEYIRRVFWWMRRLAAQAHAARLASTDDGFDAGMEAALLEVLTLMQDQATSFGIDKSSTGMSGFDPTNDPLEPPEY